MAATLVEKPSRLPISFQGSLKRPGRKKGDTNHEYKEAKWCVKEAFRLCGGVDGMVKWAKKNPNEFYPLYIRTMVPKPLEDNHEDGQITLIIQQRPTSTLPLQLDTTTCSDPASRAEEAVIAHE